MTVEEVASWMAKVFLSRWILITNPVSYDVEGGTVFRECSIMLVQTEGEGV
jgi:hypothetical protein